MSLSPWPTFSRQGLLKKNGSKSRAVQDQPSNCSVWVKVFQDVLWTLFWFFRFRLCCYWGNGLVQLTQILAQSWQKNTITASTATWFVIKHDNTDWDNWKLAYVEGRRSEHTSTVYTLTNMVYTPYNKIFFKTALFSYIIFLLVFLLLCHLSPLSQTYPEIRL